MYCASTDIVALIPEARLARMLDLGDQDTVSSEKINGFINVASSDADAILAPRYVIPITGPQSKAALVGPVAKLTIELMFQYNSEGKLPEGVKDQADKAREALKAFLEPATGLPDATLVALPVVKSVGQRRIDKVFGTRHEERL